MADNCTHPLWEVVEETDEGTALACRFCGKPAFVPKTK